MGVIMNKKLKVEKRVIDDTINIDIKNLENGVVRLDGIPYIFVENHNISFYKLGKNSGIKENTRTIVSSIHGIIKNKNGSE